MPMTATDLTRNGTVKIHGADLNQNDINAKIQEDASF